MKTVFLLAGFDLDSTAIDNYYDLSKCLKEEGYRVVPVGITWRNKTPSQYTDEFIELYNKEKSEHNIVIGNSFGAVVAFLALPRIDVKEAYLCSLSPFFKEDRGKKPDHYGIRYFGKRRMEDLWSYSAKMIASNINGVKVRVLYGEKEHKTSPDLVARCKEVASWISGAELHEIKDAPHDMVDHHYSIAIVSLVSNRA